MPISEQEEFEFRLRAEKEAAAKKPKLVNGQDWGGEPLPGEAPKQPPVDESVNPLTYGVGALETVLSQTTGAAGQALGGFGAALTGGTGADQQAIADALTYEPRTSGGKYIAEGQRKAMDVLKIPPLVPELAATRVPSISAKTSAAPAAAKPGFVRSLLDKLSGPKTPPTVPVSPAAKDVMGKLRESRAAMESKKAPIGTGKLSSVEQLVQDQQELATSLRNQIFPNAKPVDLSNALTAIAHIEKEEVDKGIVGAAREAKATINRAIEKAGGGNQFAGMTASQRAQWGAFLSGRQTKAPEVSLEMADRIRQSLQDDINRIGEGQLSNRAKTLIAGVRDAVTGAARNASPEYGDYLSRYGENAQKLSAYRQEGGVLAKLTRENGAFDKLTPQDAHNLLSDVFGGKTPGRDFQDLVDLTKHSDFASKSLRTAYGDWLTKTHADTNLTYKGDLFSRWDKTRDAVEQSGLFTKDHISNINKVLDDLRASTVTSGVKEAASTVAGFFVGSRVGHPIIGAREARKFASSANVAPAKAAIANAVANAAMSPKGAKLLSAPPTPQNIAEAMRLYAVMTGRAQQPQQDDSTAAPMPGTISVTGIAR